MHADSNQYAGATKDEAGNIDSVTARLVPDTKSGTPGADSVKVKGAVTCVGAADGLPATVNLYDRLFTEEQPDADGRDLLTMLNPNSLTTVQAHHGTVTRQRAARGPLSV